MDQLRQIGVFTSVAEHASFAAAGEALGLTGSAVSKSVAALEASLGVPLFHRTTHGIRLTSDGSAFHQRCRVILDQLAQAQGELAGSRDLAQGRLRVLLHPGPARAVIVPALPGFLRCHPGLHVDVRLDYDAADFVSRGFDLCVLYGEPSATWGGSGPRANLLSRRLAQSQLLTCAAPSYVQARGQPQKPKDLQQHDCLAMVYADGAALTRWRFSRGSQRMGVEVRPLMAINDGPALVHAALAGQGIVHLPAINLDARIARGELVRLLPDWHSAAPPITAVFAESARKLMRLRVFVQFLEALFASDPPAPHTMGPPPAHWPVKRSIQHRRAGT